MSSANHFRIYVELQSEQENESFPSCKTPRVKGDVLGKGGRKGSRGGSCLNDLRDSPQRVGCDSFLLEAKARWAWPVLDRVLTEGH